MTRLYYVWSNELHRRWTNAWTRRRSNAIAATEFRSSRVNLDVAKKKRTRAIYGWAAALTSGPTECQRSRTWGCKVCDLIIQICDLRNLWSKLIGARSGLYRSRFLQVKYLLESSRRDLSDVQPYPPLQKQKCRKRSSRLFCCTNWYKLQTFPR